MRQRQWNDADEATTRWHWDGSGLTMRRRRRRRPPGAMMMSSCAMRMSSSAIMMRRRHLERLKHSVLDNLGLYNSVARSCFTCTPRHTVLSSRALCPPNHHCESQSSFAVHCRRTIFHRKHAKQSSIQMPWIRMLFEQLQPCVIKNFTSDTSMIPSRVTWNYVPIYYNYIINRSRLLFATQTTNFKIIRVLKFNENNWS